MSKWTPEQRKTYDKTIKAKRRAMFHERRRLKKAAKKAITVNGGKHPLAPKELPVVVISNSHEDAIQFATFMATAWKMFRE